MELVELKTVPGACQQLASAAGAFLQDPEWGDFQISLGKKVRRFAVQNENGQPVLYAQTIEHAIGGKHFLFAPYGPVFPSELSLNEQQEVFRFFVTELPKITKGLMFFRFESESDISSSALQPQLKKTIDLNPHQTLLLDLRTTSEKVLAEMKPKTRYNIRLAEKSGIEVRVLKELPIPAAGGEDPITVSAKRAEIRAYTPEYFNSLLKFFSNPDENVIQARCYAAYHEGDLLAANIMIEYGGRSTYLFGGALELKRNLMPSYLLHWQAIQDAQARSWHTYDFWGVETDENHPWYGFSKFKLGFGGSVVRRPGTVDFIYNSAWYNAYALARRLNRLKNKLHFRH